MTGVVTIELVAVVFSVCSVAFVVWFFIDRQNAARDHKTNARIDKEVAALKNETALLHKRVTENKDKLNAFQLEVMDKYASVNHLEKVEDRLITAVEKLTDEVKLLRGCWPEPRATREPKS